MKQASMMMDNAVSMISLIMILPNSYTVIEINSGTHENIKDIMHAQEPRTSGHKSMTHTVATTSLTL